MYLVILHHNTFHTNILDIFEVNKSLALQHHTVTWMMRKPVALKMRTNNKEMDIHLMLKILTYTVLV